MELRRVIFRSAVLVERPGERPLHAALLVGELRLADEGLRRQRLALLQRRGEKVGEPVGEVDVVLLRRMVALFQKALVAVPADLDAALETGLGARHAVEDGKRTRLNSRNYCASRKTSSPRKRK